VRCVACTKIRAMIFPRNHNYTVGKHQSPMERASRNQHIYTVRGIACVLLVIYHAIGDTAASGLRIEDDAYWRYLANILAYIRMPLFAFIAGFVYAWKPFTGDVTRFLGSKARRLLLPMVVVGTLFAIVQSTIPGTNATLQSLAPNWKLLHIVPVAHYWFLESLFIIFLAVVIIEPLGLLAEPLLFSATMGAAIVTYLFNVLPWHFGISGAAHLFPFFLFGLACHRFRIGSTILLFTALACFAGTICYVSAGLMGWIPMAPRNSVAALLLGVSASFLMVRVSWNVRMLSLIGISAYAIFLFHPFFTAASRMVLHWLDIRDINLLVLATTSMGIVGPILVATIASISALARTCLFGEAWTRKVDPSRKESTVAEVRLAQE
jgi:hypothetical protein